MILPLHHLRIRLQSESTAVNQGWQQLYSDGLLADSNQADFQIQIELKENLPDLPNAKPIFTDKTSDANGIISVYKTENGRFLLHFHDGALIELPANAENSSVVSGTITETALAHGRLDDTTFTSLAPLLRQQELYLIHAFAASKNGRALILAGATGSGKTTTGLNLLLNGWRLLANDVVMLQKRADEFFALPTPGMINIRAQTFEQLPQLRRLLPNQVLPKGSVAVSSYDLVHGKWSQPAQVRWLGFPQVTQRPSSTLIPQKRAVALVKLMEESVDRWDEAALPAHVAFLEALCRQTAVYDLLLGQDFVDIPSIIETQILADES